MHYKLLFPAHMEKSLAEYIQEVSGRYYGLTSEQVRQLAYEFAERNDIPHNFDRNTKTAGVD